MRFVSLTNEEKASTGFTHRLDFSYRDIPAGIANNTSNTFNTAPLPKVGLGDVITECEMHVSQPFQNTADAALNSTTISFGLVTGGVAALIAATETNQNGTVVLDTIPGVATPAVPIKNTTAGNQLTLTVNSMAAKSISNLNRGRIYILASIYSFSGQSITKGTPFGDGYT